MEGHGPDMAPRDAYRTDPIFLHYSEVAFNKRMVELLEDGTIGPDMAPLDAYRTDPIFLQYSEVAFKSQLKKWKDMVLIWHHMMPTGRILFSSSILKWHSRTN